MKNLRIAWLLTSAFYYWQPTMKSLSQLFPQTTVFTSRWHGYAPGLENSFQVEIVGERKIVALSASKQSYGDNFTYLPLGIIKPLITFTPDVIFSNSFGMWTLLVLLLKPIIRWRVVIAYEGSSPGVDYRHSTPRLALRRLMVRWADACISNSHRGGDYLKTCLNCPPQNLFVHPYEVPLPHVLTVENQTFEQDFKNKVHPPLKKTSDCVFLFVGGIIPRKGLNFLLEACHQLESQGKCNYELWVVGDGGQKAELEQWSEAQGLTERIRWWGRVDYGELGSYFHQADVFVFPTLEDTWGMVVLEALVCGKPVLCSQWAGACELIQEGKNGSVFDPRATDILAQKMALFLEQPSLAATWGEQAKILMEQYSPEQAAQFLSRVAETLCLPPDH
ncbi:glycosyltransferase family 4 protein [Spirulina subsalsa]|uniref:glycosyltransferase family 4 protein n=1 Tax=Spirulina subsalsa TaxID=54311 RepID=UPI0002DE40CA|nr:glycosyltransferase family 4 protein [Spirulina subsalsa]